jgi:hypothetical protein
MMELQSIYYNYNELGKAIRIINVLMFNVN